MELDAVESGRSRSCLSRVAHRMDTMIGEAFRLHIREMQAEAHMRAAAVGHEGFRRVVRSPGRRSLQII
jgi:hypothetical protein